VIIKNKLQKQGATKSGLIQSKRMAKPNDWQRAYFPQGKKRKVLQ
jgi:hypothetical protein